MGLGIGNTRRMLVVMVAATRMCSGIRLCVSFHQFLPLYAAVAIARKGWAIRGYSPHLTTQTGITSL